MAKILIVDDSSTSRDILTRLIGSAHDLTEAASGQEALDTLSCGNYDLVILDLLMPGKGGTEVLGELAARGSDVPVIVVTADIQNSTKARVRALGAAGLVTKPLRKEALESAIAAALLPAALLPAAPLPVLEPFLKDAFEELMNIAIGKAAEVLGTMLRSHIDLSVPSIELMSAEGLTARFSKEGSDKLAAIEMRCAGGLDASIELIFTSKDATKLADCVMGEEAKGKPDRDSMRSGALCEVGNIVINAVLGTISNVLGIEMSYTVPSYLEGGAMALVSEISLATRGVILLVRARFAVADLRIDGDIALFLSLLSFEDLARMMRDSKAMP